MSIETKNLSIIRRVDSEILARPLARPETSEVLGPETWEKNPELAADIMIKILSANYGTHNLTNDKNKLIHQIVSAELSPFITSKRDACAALIKLSQFDVEIGRAACFPGENGGKSAPIITAFKAWENGIVFPESKILRAEIRTAKPTKEVPGGLATQAIFLRNDKLGFRPTAVGPFFHHGEPDRQEIFILATICKTENMLITKARELWIPDIAVDSEAERETLGEMWTMNFNTDLRLKPTGKMDTSTCDFYIQNSGPLILVSPIEKTNPNWQRILEEKFNEDKRFALARLPLNENTTISPITGAIIKLKTLGFKLIGFEPEFNETGWGINLLMGKLSPTGQQKLIMPCFTEGIFNHDLENSLLRVSIDWREK